MGISDVERWVIGSDKKPKFQFKDKSDSTIIALSTFVGYGVIVFNPLNSEVGRYGTGLAGFSTGEIAVASTGEFEVTLDKSLNTMAGIYSYRLVGSWTDSDFADGDYDVMTDNREPLYLSVLL